jgi:hypothetical protein
MVSLIVYGRGKGEGFRYRIFCLQIVAVTFHLHYTKVDFGHKQSSRINSAISTL